MKARWTGRYLTGCVLLSAMIALLPVAGAQDQETDEARAQIGRLIVALSDPWEHFRAAAARILGEKYGPAATEAIPALLKAFHDESWEVQWYAADALVRIGPQPSMIPDLIWLFHDNRSAREPVIKALTKIGAPAIPAALALLDFDENLDGTDDAQTWMQGAAILSGMGKAAVPALIEAVRDRKKFWGATAALGEMGSDGAGAVPALLEVAQDPKKRGRVAFALDGIGSAASEAVPLLVEAVRTTENRYERESAIEALGKIGPAASLAVSALRERLRKVSDRPEVWNSASVLSENNYQQVIEALGAIGPAAKEAIPELQQALKHPYDNIRRAAAEALRRIGEGAVP